QHVDGVITLVRQARELGFASINTDMIYGLPHQTPESFADSIKQLIALSPDRVSVFNYAHLPERFAAQRKLKKP
ncbi:oxygen-independent coproporphyrinogen III oxidase, partial [Pseudoalteromonas sp. S3178]